MSYVNEYVVFHPRLGYLVGNKWKRSLNDESGSGRFDTIVGAQHRCKRFAATTIAACKETIEARIYLEDDLRHGRFNEHSPFNSPIEPIRMMMDHMYGYIGNAYKLSDVMKGAESFEIEVGTLDHFLRLDDSHYAVYRKKFPDRDMSAFSYATYFAAAFETVPPYFYYGQYFFFKSRAEATFFKLATEGTFHPGSFKALLDDVLDEMKKPS